MPARWKELQSRGCVCYCCGRIYGGKKWRRGVDGIARMCLSDENRMTLDACERVGIRQSCPELGHIAEIVAEAMSLVTLSAGTAAANKAWRTRRAASAADAICEAARALAAPLRIHPTLMDDLSVFKID